MSEQEPGQELVLAHSGQLVSLDDPAQVGKAFQEVREIRDRLQEADRVLRAALVELGRVTGSKTLYIDGVGKFEIRGGEATEWPDPLGLADDLRAAGMPENVVDEIVTTRIEYRVDARRANRAASANEEYAKIIQGHRHTVERQPTVSIT